MEHADYFSFGLTGIDLTHTVHWFYFGARPSPQGYHQLQRLHPLGLHPDWLDKLKGRTYTSESLEHTHEHYLKVRCCVRCLQGCYVCVSALARTCGHLACAASDLSVLTLPVSHTQHTHRLCAPLLSRWLPSTLVCTMMRTSTWQTTTATSAMSTRQSRSHTTCHHFRCGAGWLGWVAQQRGNIVVSWKLRDGVEGQADSVNQLVFKPTAHLLAYTCLHNVCCSSPLLCRFDRWLCASCPRPGTSS